MIPSIHRTARNRAMQPALVLALLLLSLAGMPFTAPAGAAPAPQKAAPESHDRSGQLSWQRTATNTAEFHATAGIRRSWFGTPNVGDTVSFEAIYFGDGASSDSDFTVEAVNATNDWILVEKTVTHAYAGAGPYTAYFGGCCRLSTPQHINNPDQSFQAETIVNFATTANPTTSLPPIVDCPLNANCTFQIVAVNPANQPMRFRFSTATEAGDSSFHQPGPPEAPTAATISAGGQSSWNTTGAQLNTDPTTPDTYYSTQVMIEALDTGGNVVTKSPVDFFIRLSTSSNRPPTFTAPTRPDGTAFTIGIQIGNYLALPIHATDPDTGDVVTLAVLNQPSGSHFTPPTPAQTVATTITWTPGAADLGQHVLNFTATDQHGAQALISVSINVVNGCVPYFLDVASGPNPPQDYFFIPVQYLFCHSVVSGYLEPDQTFTFRPYNDATRAQFSKMVVLGKGWAIDTTGGPHFTDVPPANPFYTYIETAYNHGIISGYADGTFRWGNSATRGQIAKILWTALGSPAPGP
jgi:hypothetical protein